MHKKFECSKRNFRSRASLTNRNLVIRNNNFGDGLLSLTIYIIVNKWRRGYTGRA